MGLKEPKTALPNLLPKLKRKTAKAEKTGDWMQLCLEMTDLTGQKKEIVGPTCMCEVKGITPQWLQQGTRLSKLSVVAERSSLPYSSSGVSNRMWVRIPAVTLVSLSKTLNHNCFSPPRG